MRSYGQYCPLARALDVVGDRWSLLIVRELLLSERARYTDLRNGLPGIATNLLADRLRELEEAGIIRSEVAPPPVATKLFELTARGRELEPVLYALGRWGGPLLAGASDDDAFQSYWLALPLRLHLVDTKPDGPAFTIEVRTGDEPLLIESDDGGLSVRPGRDESADLVLTGPHRLITAVLLAGMDIDQARPLGLASEGDTRLLRRVRPLTPAATG
jgi:DNA-binding HxlR family transcriptional regulator